MILHRWQAERRHTNTIACTHSHSQSVTGKEKNQTLNFRSEYRNKSSERLVFIETCYCKCDFTICRHFVVLFHREWIEMLPIWKQFITFIFPKKKKRNKIASYMCVNWFLCSKLIGCCFLPEFWEKIIISSATSSKIQIPSDWSTIQVRKNYSSIMAKHFIQHKYTSTSTSTSSMLLHIVRSASSIHVRLYSYFHLKYPKIMYLNWNVWIGNSKHGIMSIVKLLSGCNCMAVFRASFAFRLSPSLSIFHCSM